MKTRLLKKLRKEVKRYIYLYPCGFDKSYEQCFSHLETEVKIRAFGGSKLLKKYEYEEDHATIDGVSFVYGITNIENGLLSCCWVGTCRLDKAKKILKTLRQEYILQECERMRKERLFNSNKKEYENFKKYIESL